MQRSKKALFEELYEGQLFFEWSFTLVDRIFLSDFFHSVLE